VPSQLDSQTPATASADQADGYVSSAQYARNSASLRDDTSPAALRIDQHHPLEEWARHRPFRWLLGYLSVPGRHE